MECIKRTGTLPNGKPYKEKYWRWVGEGPQVAHQVGPTSAYHVLTNSVEYNYRIWCMKNKLPIPFGRLSVEYLENRTATRISERQIGNFVAKRLATEIIENEGIMPAERYCIPYGLRGEYDWQPFFFLGEKVQYLVKAKGTWIEMQHPTTTLTPEEKFSYLVQHLKDGPVHADFFPRLLNGEYELNKGEPHGFLNPTEKEFEKTPSHAIMLVGRGKFEIRSNVWARYFIYLNTYSVLWGDKGYGRILADGMKGIYSVWIPNIVPPVDPTTGSASPPVDPTTGSTSGPSTSGH